jgi:hypothetical protein
MLLRNSVVTRTIQHYIPKEVTVTGRVVALLNYAKRHEDVLGSGCIHPRFLDLDTSWRGVVSRTPRRLYSR